MSGAPLPIPRRPVHSTAGSQDTLLASLVAALLLAIYLLGYSGVFHSIDEQASLAVSETLVREGRWHTNSMAWEQIWEPSQNAMGIDGNLYSKKGLAVPLLAAPLLALGKVWRSVGAVQFALLLNPLLTAATAALLYQLARVLAYSPSTALLAALAWGLATPAWPYARTLFSEPAAALGLCTALYAMATFRRQPAASGRYSFLAGVGLALLILARQANAVTVLPFALYWLWVQWRERQWGPARPVFWRSGILLALPTALVLAFMALQSSRHFGRLLGHPLDPVEGFTTPLAVGLAGLLASPGKGILWYMPLVLLILPALGHWRATKRLPDFLLALGAFVMVILIYSVWWDWAGGTAWGPRLLVTTTPALVMLALPALDRLWQPEIAWRRAAIAAVLVLSVLVQLPGVLVNTGVLEGWEYYLGISRSQQLWDWRYSPQLSHWRTLLWERITEPLWLQPHFWQQPASLVATALVAVAAALGLSLYGLVGAQHHRPRQWTLGGATLALMTLLVLLPLAAQGDPRWQEKHAEAEDNRQLWTFLETAVQPGDVAVVDMLPYYDLTGRTASWMNATPLDLAYIGWLRMPAGETPASLAQWLAGYRRIWLSLAMTPPGSPDSTTESWLDRWAFRGEEFWFGTQRLVTYLLPSDTLLAQVETPVHFGNRLTLQAYTVQTAVADGYRLAALAWQGAGDPDLRFSLQVLDGEGLLAGQIDRTPGSLSGDPAQDRIAIAVPDGAYTLILKAYDAATGEPFPVSNAAGVELGDYWVLAGSPVALLTGSR